MAPVKILKRIKTDHHGKMVSIPCCSNGRALPEGRYYIEWYAGGRGGARDRRCNQGRSPGGGEAQTPRESSTATDGGPLPRALPRLPIRRTPLPAWLDMTGRKIWFCMKTPAGTHGRSRHTAPGRSHVGNTHTLRNAERFSPPPAAKACSPSHRSRRNCL